MRPLARAAAVVAATATTAASLAAAPIAAAEDTPASLTAQITSPTTGRTVSGQQPFTVHVTAKEGVTPHAVTVTILPPTEAARPRSGTSPVPDNCAPECDVTVIVDTVSWIDPGPAMDAQDTSLPDRRGVFVEAVVTGTTPSGATMTATGTETMTVNNTRPTMWPQGSMVVVGPDPIAIQISVTPYGDTTIDRLEATLLGPAGVLRRGTFPGAPLDINHHYSLITGSLSTAGLASGNYTLRLVAFDTADRPSNMGLYGVTYYTGPKATVNRLIPQTPTEANWGTGALAEVTLSVGPDWSPFAPKQVDVYLDGNTVPAGPLKSFPRGTYCSVTPAGTEACPSTITVKVPLTTPTVSSGFSDYSTPISAGAHTVKAVYTERTSWYGESTATGTTTTQVTAPGVAAATTVKGPVVQNASGTLAFTLTSRAGTNMPATQIRSWKATPFGWAPLASGTCTGTSCLTVTGSVPLKALGGGYPGLATEFHDVPVTLTYTDSAGVTRTTTVKVGVDPAVRTNVGVTASGTAGATAYVTIGVQQVNNVMLPGVPVTLQARTAGSSTWRTVATVKTGSTGGVRVPVTLKENTYWRSVVPARVGWNGAATSAQVYTKVAAKVTASVLPTTGVRGRYYPVKATLSPASTGRRVSVQVRAYGTSTWRTVLRPATNKYGQIASNVRFGRGTWQVRVVADATTTSASGTSRTLTIKVR
ncbi:MAG: hypothetical protein ACTHJJ_11215 [Intrasporangium sp.]|uniref:hypothetical protein n=1 Tax=Intrasporangium sp. TaxID=1925024 RepID=UPI003F8068D4